MGNDRVESRAARVSMVTGLSTLMSVGFQLITVPICLKFWGKINYGNWLTLYSSFMLIRTMDTGFVSYVGNELNVHYHQSHQKMQEHLASSYYGIIIIATLQLMVAIVAFFFKRNGLTIGTHHAPDPNHEFALSLLILVVTWALTAHLMNIVHRLLIPCGLMYQSAWWSMGYQVSIFVGTMLAAILRLGLIQTSLLFALIQASIYLASAIYIRWKLPFYFPWWRGARWATGIRDLGRSLMLTMSDLIQQGATNGSVILLSLLAGPAAIPVFTTCRTLANLWTNVTNVLTTPLLPDVVRFHAKDEGQKIVNLSEAYWVLVGNTVNFGVLITFPLVRPMYTIWTAQVMRLDEPLLCMLLCSVVVANAGGFISMYLNGINRLGIVLASSAGRGVLSLAIGALLFQRLGASGFGIGILGGELLALFLMGRYFVKHELWRHGTTLSYRSLAPILLSASSVMLFLAMEGFGINFADYLYLPALMGVVFAGLWGWDGLDAGVRTRLVHMVGGRS